jgi:Cu(I)/Ag(I) efflux system protein CusF
MNGFSMHVFPKLALALAMSIAAPLASAQEHGHGSHGAQPAAATGLADAEVKKIDREAGKITLRHGELKNLNMPGMTMVFRVKEASMLDRVKAGDQVKFSADRVNGAITVVQLEPAQ